MGTFTRNFGRLAGVGAVCAAGLLFGGAGLASAEAPMPGTTTAHTFTESGGWSGDTSDNDNLRIRELSPVASAMDAVKWAESSGRAVAGAV
ncbi:hypothetical protein [Streptomyces sp. 891-h]|uniref:hypothetical protein n=1 Tax=unclassified Streptomyces TaxID=2593676 RepID=UPI001FA95EDC|nr:hypothetical protein [Streptomyces sp. 891-h]UNZ21001.1 hypothetical protein HC362_31885 [Streptomyces sp. 891-h]